MLGGQEGLGTEQVCSVGREALAPSRKKIGDYIDGEDQGLRSMMLSSK